MRIAICQVNPTLADLPGNVALCLVAARKAARQAPDLIVFPEMVIPGYPPRDLLYDEDFVTATLAASADFAAQCEGLPPVLFGSIARTGDKGPKANRLIPRLLNVAYLARRGKMSIAAEKRLLPVYDVFYEPRWFRPGQFHPPLEIGGQKVGILICEDLWDEDYDIHPAAELKAAGANVLVCLSASPYRQGVLEKRLEQARRVTANAQNLPLVFVNLVGANDELIFDGRSFTLEGEGIREGKAFEEDMAIFDIRDSILDARISSIEYRISSNQANRKLISALTLGIRDFARKNGLKRAFLGVSGGIDSALAAVLAVKALGAENVTGIAIPSRFSDPRSTESARELCQNLGCRFEIVQLEPLHAAAESLLVELSNPATFQPSNLQPSTFENVQARLRMVVLMGYVNQFGGFLINTGNKTELALGYSTLYGDMAGALCPLADLTKPQVYELARFLNEEFRMQNADFQRNILHSAFCIPDFILSRPPSAELRPDQVDPFDYETISPELESIVQGDESHPALKRSEHKRWQFGIVAWQGQRARFWDGPAGSGDEAINEG
jgi:NAD+ synthase (glutamine-hydrolysing)